MIVEPGIFSPRNGSVGIDLIAPGYEATWEPDIADRRSRFTELVFPNDALVTVNLTIDAVLERTFRFRE